MNAVSLVCGVVGNGFLLFNFTHIIRYIIALPVTIILWFLATGIVSDTFRFATSFLTLPTSYVESPSLSRFMLHRQAQTDFFPRRIGVPLPRLVSTSF